MTILEEIVHHKKMVELPKRKAKQALETVQSMAQLMPESRDFGQALRDAPGVALIAEVKRASPSKGLLRPHFNHVDLASDYFKHGASAISVLTDGKYFQGKLDFISDIQKALSPLRQEKKATCPILRKEFIIDSYQVYESKVAGADALLLIVACLKDDDMAKLLTLSHKVGLTALVEVHNKTELDRVLPLKPRLIGVNNRNLHDFSVDLNTCITLRQFVPDDICFVAESGIHVRADVQRLAKEGVDAILVGEAIVKQKKVGAKVAELSGVPVEKSGL